MATSGTDWVAWHGPYSDPGSSLSRRRRVVQQHVRDWLGSGALLTSRRVVSACSGDGRDLLEVLAAQPGAGLDATLVELDPRLAAAATRYAREHGLAGVRVRVEDAGRTTAYRDAVPADLVLFCGVFGNVSPDDVRGCVARIPQLCAAGATVVWTRGRDADGGLTGADVVRQAFAAAGFEEATFTAPADASFGVGVHRYVAPPVPWVPGVRLFSFVR